MSAADSARPDDLQAFVDLAKPANATLVSAINRLRASYDQFQASGSIPVSNPDLMDTAIPALVSTQQVTDDFVTVTRQAFIDADSQGGTAGVVTVSSSSFQSAFDKAAANAGLDPNALSGAPTAVTVSPASVGAIPADSGYVNDPICTATGHFTELEVDFELPPRLGTLAWTRAYSSRLLEDTGHGRGWWTWASASLRRADDGQAAYQGPDGKHGRFWADDQGRWQRLPGVEAALSDHPAGLALRWDMTSPWPGQEWRFGEDGHVQTVSGPTLAPTHFVYQDDQLVRLVTDGGRELHLDRRHGRVVGTRLSDGRSVSYDYDSAGDLIGVDGASGARRYDVDGGLIVAVHDADGVRLCHNTYDDAGRVTRQVSPLGRQTVLDYLPGRRTRIGDTEAGPSAVFEHDEIGRLIGITNAEGRTFTRTFEPDGRIGAQRSFDGSQLQRVITPDGTAITTSGGDVETWHYDALERVVAYERPGGRIVRFAYDGASMLPARIDDPMGGSQSFDYDAAGLLRAAEDGDGLRVELDYDQDGSLVASRDALGGSTSLDVGPTGRARRIDHPDGTSVHLDVDDGGRLLAVTDEEGNRFALEYTPAGRLKATTDPRGARVVIEYASSGQVERIVDPLGGAVELRYDQLASLVGLTNPDGSKWEFAHTLLGELSMVHAPDGAVSSIGYDPEGRPTSFVDPLGHHTRAVLDGSGRIRTRVDAAGFTSSYHYDEAGNLVSLVDATGAVTQMSWDLLDRLIERVDPDGVVERRRYSAAGRLVEVVTGTVRTTLGYDEGGRLATMTTPDGVWHYRYDARHRLVDVTSPAGRSTHVERDRAGRVISTVVGPSRFSVGYDEAGNVISRTDPLGHTQHFDYDLAGRITVATDPVGNRVEYRYDAAGNRITVVDPLGRSSHRHFDARRRVVREEDQLGRVTGFTYDLAGLLKERATPTGERIGYAWDERGLITDVFVDGVNVIVYEHDGAGRSHLVHEPGRDRTETFGWSGGGRLLRWSDEQRSMAWRYDEDGRVAWRRDALGTETAYRYDTAGHLRGVQGETWGTVELDHDADGLLTSLRTPGSLRTWHYDGAGWMTGYACRTGERSSSVDLGHDGAGRVTRVTEGSTTTGYAYDPAGRLVAADAGDLRTTWEYDGAGRRVAERTGDRVRTWHYDDAHQLTDLDDGDEHTVFTYDAAGRRVGERGPTRHRRLRWDGLGRLAGIDDGDGELAVDVDASGHLVGVGDTTLAWDPNPVAEEISSVAEQSVLAVAGHVVALCGPSSVDWVATDWRGSLGTRGPWGEAPDRPAGDARAGQEATWAQLGFLGEVEVAGLVWLRSRLYDPASAQFVSADPLPGVPGMAASAFPYHYADDDPLGRLDPLGLRPVSVAEFNKIRNQATSIQWGNIAGVVASVAAGVVLVALMPESVLGAVALGAALGAGAGAVPGVVNGLTGRGWNWGQIARGAIVGGVIGAVAGPAAKFLPTQGVAAVATSTGAGAASGAAQTGLNYAYDATPLPGSTGHPVFDPGNLAWNSATGAASGLASGGVVDRLNIGAHPETPVEPASPLIVPHEPTLIAPAQPRLLVPQTPIGYSRLPSGVMVPSGPPGFTQTPSGLYVPSH